MAFAAAALPVISLVATAAGAAVSAYGQMQAGKASQQAAEYQAAVARNNATIARQNAAAERDAAAAKAQDEDLRTRQRLGALEASQGASGFDVNTGSAVDVRVGQANLGRLSSLRIVDEGDRRARNFEAQAGNFDAQAGLDVMSGENARTSGQMGALSSIIGGAANFSDKWMTYKNSGALKSPVLDF